MQIYAMAAICTRRARILVVCLAIMFAAAGFFFMQNLLIANTSGRQQMTALGLGGLAMLLNLMILNRTQDPILRARIMCVEVFVAVVSSLVWGRHARCVAALAAHRAVVRRHLRRHHFWVFLVFCAVAFGWLYKVEPLVRDVALPTFADRTISSSCRAGAALAMTACAAIFERRGDGRPKTPSGRSVRCALSGPSSRCCAKSPRSRARRR